MPGTTYRSPVLIDIFSSRGCGVDEVFPPFAIVGRWLNRMSLAINSSRLEAIVILDSSEPVRSRAFGFLLLVAALGNRLLSRSIGAK